MFDCFNTGLADLIVHQKKFCKLSYCMVIDNLDLACYRFICLDAFIKNDNFAPYLFPVMDVAQKVTNMLLQKRI